MHRPSYLLTAALAVAMFVPSRPLAASPRDQQAKASRADDTDLVAVLSAALEDIREEFPFGHVVVDRVVLDTTKRLAPPLMSGREHPLPERWAKPLRVEPVHTDFARPVCRSGNVDCALPNDIAAAIAFADPDIVGDSARVIARYSRTTGVTVQRVTTVVEVITLRKHDGEWTVARRTIKATS